MIAITVAGKTKYTSAKNDVSKASSVNWGEHLFFDKNNVVRFKESISNIEQSRDRIYLGSA